MYQAAGGVIALLNLPCSSDIDALNLPTNKLTLLPLEGIYLYRQGTSNC